MGSLPLIFRINQHKQMAHLQKSKYLLRNLVIKQKLRRLQQVIHVLKAIDPANSNLKLQISKFLNLNVYSRKTENVQIHFKGVCAKIFAKFLCRGCTIWLLLSEAFQRALKC